MAAALALGVSACAPVPGGVAGPVAPEYLGVTSDVLGGGLVQFRLALRGEPGRALVADYARCAAARYAAAGGYGFARHVRTLAGKQAGIWRADAIYTVTAALPRGIDTIDAEVVARDCDERGVPAD